MKLERSQVFVSLLLVSAIFFAGALTALAAVALAGRCGT